MIINTKHKTAHYASSCNWHVIKLCVFAHCGLWHPLPQRINLNIFRLTWITGATRLVIVIAFEMEWNKQRLLGWNKVNKKDSTCHLFLSAVGSFVVPRITVIYFEWHVKCFLWSQIWKLHIFWFYMFILFQPSRYPRHCDNRWSSRTNSQRQNKDMQVYFLRQ